VDNHRFDLLAKSLGTSGNRRHMLKRLLGFGGAAALAAVAPTGSTEAARRPTKPDPKPVVCPGIQIPIEGTCRCPDELSECGPDCCNPGGRGADYSECCDGACCHGTCYGEEMCCPYPNEWCGETWECCPEGTHCCGDAGCIDTSVCCSDAHCTDYPNSSCDLQAGTCVCSPSTCNELGACGTVSDGCSGTLECGGCSDGFICSEGRCVDDPDICVAGESYCEGIGGQCGGGEHICVPGLNGETYCIQAYFQLGAFNCGQCYSNGECVAKTGNSGAVCVKFDSMLGCMECGEKGACALPA